MLVSSVNVIIKQSEKQNTKPDSHLFRWCILQTLQIYFYNFSLILYFNITENKSQIASQN